MATNILGLMDYVQEQGDRGRSRGMENAFRKLTPNALTGDMAAYEQQVALNPQAAMQVQKAGDVTAQRVRGAAKYMQEALASEDPARIQGAWAGVRPFLAKVGQAQGKVPPEQWDDSLMPGLQEALAKTAYLDSANVDTPSGYRQFELMAKAAGLKPGTPEYRQAANIALGREGRAATGGFGFELVEGPDGRKRLQRRNPRTGAVEMYDEMTGDFVPQGGGAALNGGQAGVTFTAEDGASVPTAQFNATDGSAVRFDAGVPAEFRNQVLNQPAAFAAAPDGATANLPSVDRSPSQYRAATLGVGRRPEDEAAAVEAAKQQTQLGYLPQELQLRTQASLAEAQGKAGIETEAGLATTQAKRSASADDALVLLSEAERLIPASTGSGIGALVDRGMGMIGVADEGAQAIASLQAIAGQLVAKMPRMEGPQSDRDVQMYKDMAGNLADATIPREQRMAALRTIRQLQSKYASPQARPSTQQQQPARVQRARNPQTGEVLELRNGQWVPAQ